MIAPTMRKLFSVSEYTQMWQAGVLDEEDCVELLAGEIRIMSPIGPTHASIVNRLNALLSQQLAGIAIVSVQNPIQLDDFSQPQPDIAVLHYRDDYYVHAAPVTEDVLLVIEVADTTIDYDRDEKLPRYAATAIGEAWLVDVANRTVEQYLEPRGVHYRIRRLLEQDDVITATVIAGLSLPVEHILP